MDGHAALRECEAILLGAVGDPRVRPTHCRGTRPQSGAVRFLRGHARTTPRAWAMRLGAEDRLHRVQDILADLARTP